MASKDSAIKDLAKMYRDVFEHMDKNTALWRKNPEVKICHETRSSKEVKIRTGLIGPILKFCELHALNRRDTTDAQNIAVTLPPRTKHLNGESLKHRST